MYVYTYVHMYVCICLSMNICLEFSYITFNTVQVEPRRFTLKILHCLPGFESIKTADGLEQCTCDTRSDVLYCSPDQTTILLKVNP